jgi:hypothetical protein
MSIRIELTRAMFAEREIALGTMGEFRVSTFRYSSGIEALRLANKRGYIDVLPFRGQQIWRAVFDGRDLTMKSMFDEPVATSVYLETYGAFFIHCGLSGMGAPGPGDRHPLHGELPNAPFQKAWLDWDEAGGTITVGGSYHYAVAFSTNYLATATITMAEGSTVLDLVLTVDNLKKTPMDLMYLAHANFRPVDGGELIYSAPYTAEAVRVRQAIPSHITPKPGYAEFIAALAKEPALHHRLEAGLAFDPEIVFTIDMEADEQGFAHALQKRPDGTSDYIRYRPSEAAKCIRWICRTPDQDAVGMAFPATAETEGYTAEKAKGNLVELEGGKTWSVAMRLGTLDRNETAALAALLSRR